MAQYTYRAVLDAVAVLTGAAFELIPARGRNCRLTQINLTLSTSVKLTQGLYSTVTTGGTSTSPTRTKMGSVHNAPASGATVKVFTAAPTAGTLEAALDIRSSGSLIVDYTKNVTQENASPVLSTDGTTLRAFALIVGGNVTVSGFFEWCEESPAGY